jgi:hypothetical protein
MWSPLRVRGMSTDADDGGADQPMTVEMEVADGRTVITVSGQRDAAAVVRSASGERVYLPPEDFDEEPDPDARLQSPYRGAADSRDDNPYQPAREGPYQSSRQSDSPYDGAPDPTPTEGVESTPEGFRIVHPEPATDVRVLR